MTAVQLHFLENKGLDFNGDQRNFLEEIAKKIQTQINSETFKDQVLNFKYKRGRRWYEGFRLNKNKTRNQIYTIVMSGKDPYDNKDGTIDIYLKPYITKPKIHATTYSGVRAISLNTRYIDYCITKDKFAEMAGTLIHEYTHILGFRHYTNSGKKRDKPTVPWGIGKIIKKLVKG